MAKRSKLKFNEKLRKTQLSQRGKFYTAVVTSIAIRSKKDITCPHRKAGEGRAAVSVITAPDGAGKPTAPTYGSQPPFRENHWDGDPLLTAKTKKTLL